MPSSALNIIGVEAVLQPVDKYIVNSFQVPQWNCFSLHFSEGGGAGQAGRGVYMIMCVYIYIYIYYTVDRRIPQSFGP